MSVYDVSVSMPGTLVFQPGEAGSGRARLRVRLRGESEDSLAIQPWPELQDATAMDITAVVEIEADDPYAAAFAALRQVEVQAAQKRLLAGPLRTEVPVRGLC